MSVYTETEELPKWFVKLGMAIALVAPYEVAGILLVGLVSLLGQLMGLITGLVIMLIALPIISAIVIGIAKVWYDNEYWHSDADNTRFNPIIMLIIIAFPIAFVFSLNSSLGLYFGLTVLTAVFLVTIFYRFQPRVETRVGYRFGLFWAGVVSAIVLAVLSTYLVVYRHTNPLSLLLPNQFWLSAVAPLTTDGYFILASKPVTELQIITELGFMAFVVGFAEEGWARLSIPMMAKYFDGNVVLSVWWLGTAWLSLHAVVIAYEAVVQGVYSAFAVAFNLVILALISLFIFYVFAKTGDYVASAIAHGFYDMTVTLGIIGLAVAIILILTNYRYHRV